MKIFIENVVGDESSVASAFCIPEGCVKRRKNGFEISFGEAECSERPPFYRLKRDETLASVCRKFSIPFSAIIKENEGLETAFGVTLKIPRFSGRIYTVKPLDTISSVAEKFGISEEELVAINGVTYLSPGIILDVGKN